MPVRHCLADIETTGFNTAGHKVVELAVVEMIDFIETGRTFRTLVNPRRPIPAEATKIHGIVDADVVDAPLFRTAFKQFKEFIGDGIVVWHNGDGFDGPFLERECRECGEPPLNNETIDTMVIARKKYPGKKASLDALADFFGIDRSFRKLHGALIDCQLLARVFFSLMGMDKLDLRRDAGVGKIIDLIPADARQTWFVRRPPASLTPEQEALHAEFVGKIPDSLWKSIINPSAA